MLISTATAQLPVLQQSVVLSKNDLPLAYVKICRAIALFLSHPRGQHIGHPIVADCEPCNRKPGDHTPALARMLLKIKPKTPMHPTTGCTEPFWNTQHPPSPELDLKIC